MHEFIFKLLLIVGIQTKYKCIGIAEQSWFQNAEVASLSIITTYLT